MLHKVVYDPAARRDLRQLRDFIRQRAGAVIADRFVDSIIAYCDRFAYFPERGTRRDELRRGLRSVGYRRRATITFRVNRRLRIVTILGVYYAGRDFTRDFSHPDLLSDDDH
jgi:plasmid stabilization system protein ParE